MELGFLQAFLFRPLSWNRYSSYPCFRLPCSSIPSLLLSYILILLNYRVIKLVWNSFQTLFSLFRRNWDIRTSVIDAFATFSFLSYVKFLSVSFDLLTPTIIYELYPDRFNHLYYMFRALNILGKSIFPMPFLRWPVRAIPLPICEFPKSDFFKQLLFQTATFPNSDEHEFSVVYPTLCSTSTNAGSGEATNRKPRCETKYLFAVGPSH